MINTSKNSNHYALSMEKYRLRELVSRLRAQISLHYENPEHSLDTMKKILHEIEFDFSDYRIMSNDQDIILEAHNILKGK